MDDEKNTPALVNGREPTDWRSHWARSAFAALLLAPFTKEAERERSPFGLTIAPQLKALHDEEEEREKRAKASLSLSYSHRPLLNKTPAKWELPNPDRYARSAIKFAQSTVPTLLLLLQRPT